MLLAFRSKTLHGAHTLNHSERNLFETRSHGEHRASKNHYPKTLFFKWDRKHIFVVIDIQQVLVD